MNLLNSCRTVLGQARLAVLISQTRRQASTLATSAMLDRDISASNLDILHDQLEASIVNDQLCPQNLVNFTKRLHADVYDSLKVYPWFQGENLDVAYIQLLVNLNVEKLNSKVSSHSIYSKLYQRCLAIIDELDANQAAHIAIAFIAIGLSLDDVLIKRALETCQRHIHDTDINDLSAISSFSRMLGRNGLDFSSRVAERADTLLDVTPACCDLLEPLLNTFNSVQLIASDALSDKFQTKFMNILQPHSCLLMEPKTMGSVLRGIRRFPLNKNEQHYRFRSSMSQLIVETVRNQMNVDALSHSNIGELCNHLQNSRLYYRDIAEKFQQKALDIISHSNRICEISNAMYAFHSKFIPRDARRIIESQVFKYMQDADVLLLSNLADTLRSMNCRNTDVMDKFHHMILNNADTLFVYITRLEKIVKHLSWNNFRSREHEDQFMTILLSKLSNTQLGLATWCLTTVACYLLRNTRYTIDPVLYDKLLRIIPQCRVRDLYPILVAMNSAHTAAPSVANQLYRLQTMIYQNVAERVETIDSLDLLSQIISELLSKSEHPDTNIIKRLMDMYPKFTKRLTRPQYHRTILHHSSLKYYNERVFEDLTDFLLRLSGDSHMEVNYLDLVRLMGLLNAVGYSPTRMNELRTLVLNFYDEHQSTMEVDELVTYVQLMAGIQVFPDDIINHIFNIDFIQRVDKFLEANPEKRQQIEYVMMKLNRMVVIECPELDIPWFHDQYCRQNIVRDYNPDDLPFTVKVAQSMTSLLGGEDYFQTWIYSPYYHFINLEILLDESGNAINLSKPINKRPKTAQKVAIRCLVESNFCYNDVELNGFEKIKRRHLEMLGYKVVELPYYEWNSMGLADEQSKSAYLSQKIFS